MPRRLGAGAILLMMVVGAASPAEVARAVEAAVAEETLERLQIPADQRRRLVGGEVISSPLDEYSERELAVGLALFVRAPLGRIADYLASGELLARDATISAHGLVPDPARPGALPAVRFSGNERDETESLLEAAP